MDERRRTVTLEQLESELQRERRRTRRRQRRHVVFRLLLALLIVLFVAGLFFAQVLSISGDAMAGTLRDGDVAVGLKLPRYANGDVIIFRYNGGVLVKRLLAQAGDWVELDHEGAFFVNGAKLDEPYVEEIARGNCDVVFPLTVPEDSCFVVGDNRALSIDSRSSVVGCIGRTSSSGGSCCASGRSPVSCSYAELFRTGGTPLCCLCSRGVLRCRPPGPTQSAASSTGRTRANRISTPSPPMVRWPYS